MQLTLFTDYSLRTLMYLALNNERRCRVKDISQAFNLSHHHMVKIVHKLSQLGYIESSKGKNGGIMLAKEADKIQLKELILELEPNFKLVECFDKEAANNCQIFPICAFKNILQEALAAFLNTIGKYTLTDTIIKLGATPNVELFNVKQS